MGEAANAAAAGHAFVVPAYKESPFLRGCLEALARQTLASRIVITTSTPNRFIDEAATAFGVEVIVNTAQGGIGADWNFALRATGARYVTLAHQDDVYFPEFLAQSLRLLSGSDASVCFTGYDEVDDGGVRKTSRLSRVKHLIEAVTLGRNETPGARRMRAFLSFGNPLPCSSATFDLERLGDFQFSQALGSNLDWEAWLRLLEEGHRFVRSPRRLMGRRHNALTETTANIRLGVRGREDLMMFRRLWPRPISEAIAYIYRASY